MEESSRTAGIDEPLNASSGPDPSGRRQSVALSNVELTDRGNAGATADAVGDPTTTGAVPDHPAPPESAGHSPVSPESAAGESAPVELTGGSTRTVADPPPEEELPDYRRGLAIIVIGMLILISVHSLVGRIRGNRVELRRLPEHRFDYRLDLNSANEVELLHLPGIGPALAQRIIEDRAARGPFPTLDSLKRVRGIGPKILEEVRPYLLDPESQSKTDQ